MFSKSPSQQQEQPVSSQKTHTEPPVYKHTSYDPHKSPSNTITNTEPSHSRKGKYTGCNCSKSQCLKMYCACFSVGRMCD